MTIETKKEQERRERQGPVLLETDAADPNKKPKKVKKDKKDKKDDKDDDKDKDKGDKKHKKDKKSPKPIPEDALLLSSDDESYFQRRRRGRRELGTITCTYIPNAANVIEWMRYMGVQVNVASGRKDKLAAQWFWKIADAKTFDSLEYVDDRFACMDQVLYVSIESAVRKLGKDKPLYNKTIGDGNLAMQRGYTTTGQQSVFRVLDSIRTNETFGTIYTIEDLTNTHCKDESIVSIENFKRKREFDARNFTGITEELKTGMLLDRLDQLKCIENRTFAFHEPPRNDPKRCQATLLNILEIYLRIDTQKRNQKGRNREYALRSRSTDPYES